MTRLVFLAAAAIVTAGCASASATGPGSPEGAASIVPSDAVVFVASSTDLDSSRWHAVAKAFLVQYERLKPALGAEIDVAVLPGGQSVALTQPTDAQKLDALAKKDGVKTRAVGEWTAIAKTDAALDAVADAKTHLAQNPSFAAAMDRLPDDALVRAYATGASVEKLISSIPGQRESTFVRGGAARPNAPHTAGATGYRWGAAAVTSADGGLRAEAFARLTDLSSTGPARFTVRPITPYQPLLVDEIPANVLAVADLQVPAGSFHLLPQLPPGLLKPFGPGMSASSLASALDTMLGGETAVYVRPALPLPEVTVVTQPRDTGQASNALDDLLAAAVRPPTLFRAAFGGEFVISTTQRGIDDFRSGGAKLSADPAFLLARKRADMPDQTTGFVYGNVQGVLPLLLLAGVKLPVGLPRISTFLVYGGQNATESTFTAFVGVG